MPSEGEPALGAPLPLQKNNNTQTTTKYTLWGSGCAWSSLLRPDHLPWKGPMPSWLVECLGEGTLGYEGLTGYNSLLF